MARERRGNLRHSKLSMYIGTMNASVEILCVHTLHPNSYTFSPACLKHTYSGPGTEFT